MEISAVKIISQKPFSIPKFIKLFPNKFYNKTFIVISKKF